LSSKSLALERHRSSQYRWRFLLMESRRAVGFHGFPFIEFFPSELGWRWQHPTFRPFDKSGIANSVLVDNARTAVVDFAFNGDSWFHVILTPVYAN
jgi:hypothetical protein